MYAAEQTAENAHRDRVVGNKVYWCICKWPLYNLGFPTFIRKETPHNFRSWNHSSTSLYTYIKVGRPL